MSANVAATACLQLKSMRLHMTVLELFHFDAIQVRLQLQARIQQAPRFFQHMPILIGLERFAGDTLDFVTLQVICRELLIIPVAVRGGSAALQAQATAAGWACLPAGKDLGAGASDAVVDAVANTAEASAPIAVTAAEVEAPIEPARIITTPIRSGQQIYVPRGDLIILAAVGAGAEVLAEGNIHVYGALRGRALAGVNGNLAARIFCSKLEAELVSVAGVFKISEDLQGDYWGKAAQISFQQDRLAVQTLVE